MLIFLSRMFCICESVMNETKWTKKKNQTERIYGFLNTSRKMGIERTHTHRTQNHPNHQCSLFSMIIFEKKKTKKPNKIIFLHFPIPNGAVRAH